MQDHAIITGTNSLISIFAGFVVYAVLGNVVYEHLEACPMLSGTQDAVSKVYGATSISLAFVVYPRVSHITCSPTCPGPTPPCGAHPAWDLRRLSWNPLPRQGLSNFPTGVSNFMGVLFFFTLMNLGIDSAFSMVEGVTTVISDTARFRWGWHAMSCEQPDAPPQPPPR